VQINGVLPLGVKQLKAGREFFLLLLCKLEACCLGLAGQCRAAAAAARSCQHTVLYAVNDAVQVRNKAVCRVYVGVRGIGGFVSKGRRQQVRRLSNARPRKALNRRFRRHKVVEIVVVMMSGLASV